MKKSMALKIMTISRMMKRIRRQGRTRRYSRFQGNLRKSMMFVSS